MWKYHCNIDWLQTYCLGNVLSDGIFSDGNMQFQVVSKHEETKLFKYVFNVYHGVNRMSADRCVYRTCIRFQIAMYDRMITACD